ncbi:hypothetical protein FHT22_001090 [Pedobacter sp. SG918]|nr:hypothetical protein [Pedobacter sp. SG918]
MVMHLSGELAVTRGTYPLQNKSVVKDGGSNL